MNPEFEKHFIISHLQIGDDGCTYESVLDVFDPKLMFEITDPSDFDNIYYTSARFKGTAVKYSYIPLDSSMNVHALTLSDGSEKVHDEIIKDFNTFFVSLINDRKVSSVSQPEFDDIDTYRWIVKTNSSHR